MNRTMIAAALAFVLPLAASAQNSWTLTDCINYALEHSITVKQNTLSVEEKEIALNTAKNQRLPGVSASSSQNFSFGRGLTADNTYAHANTTSTSFSLGGDMTLFNGFQIKNNITMKGLDLESATADLNKVKDDIRTSVAQAYVQILYNMEIVDVARQQVTIDSVQVERLRSMAAEGKASRAQVAAQEASLAQSRLSLTQAQNNLSISTLELTQLLELPSPQGFTVVRPAEDKLRLGLLRNPEDIYAEAVGFKPAIKAEELRLQNAETNIALAKGSYLPSLSLSGGLGSNFYTSSGKNSTSFGEQLRNNFSQYVGLSLNVPIFSRFSTRNSVKTAKISYESQQLQLESVKKGLYKEIQQVYYNAVASQSKYLSSQAAAKSAGEAFELTRAKYENGKADITDFNDAKGRFLSAESDLVQARYECLYQSSLLGFYEGKDLSF